MVITENDKFQEFVNEVCSQINLRDAHQEIKLELMSHLREGCDGYLSQGFSEDEAVSKAIAQMGDAALVGNQLNKVHKPKPEWSILALSLLFVSTGLLVLYFMGNQGLLTASFFIKGLIYTTLGVFIIAGLYFFDYRKLEAYSKHIYVGTILLLAITYFTGLLISGKHWLQIGGVTLDVAAISPLLFAISLAGILNKWDWSKSRMLLSGLLLCVMPLVFILLNGSLAAGVIYFITCMVFLIVSGAGYRIVLLLMGLTGGTTALSIISKPYILHRLTTLINTHANPLGSGHQNIMLRNLISSSGYYGQGFTFDPRGIPAAHTDFIFAYITYTFGWIAAIILAVLIMVFLIRMTRIAVIVKNNYARLLVSGFAAIFTVKFLWNIAMNLGFAPISRVGLPLISYGSSQLIINALAVGIILSIYKRKNLSKIFN